MNRFVHISCCDDIRTEVDGKISLMGIYADVLYVRNFPANLQRLCVVVSAYTASEKPFKDIHITAMFRDNVIAEMEIPAQELDAQWKLAPSAPLQAVQAQMIFSPIVFDQPGELQVFFRSEFDRLESNVLMVLQNGRT